ncbi:hypothetical protein ACTD5D_02285 [Nocardia takedensis]|uniref:hypothetical protein n=1 Tax=Nocardia TaxID=1817 RepID=UPI002457A88D|nr:MULTISPECIES: hypothetical protein [Nocardia]
MDSPTALQAHLLKGIQNLALDNERHRPRPAETGEPAGTDQQWGIGQRCLDQLEQVALGIGVPHAWIDYARASGQRGERWQPGRQMLGSGRVERSQLITALGRDVRGLQDMSGIGAVFTHRGVDAEVTARFRRIMGMTWQRLGAISHALGLTTEERHQVWARGERHWSTAVAERLRDTDLKSLAQDWNRIVTADFSVATIPVVVLQAAGITAADAHAAMPTSPDDMVTEVTEALALLDERHIPDPVIARTAAAIATAVEPSPEPGAALADPDSTSAGEQISPPSYPDPSDGAEP